MDRVAGSRVLVVDDDPAIAERVANRLTDEAANFTVETAMSASKGLDYFGHDDFDCIISGYELPEIDGIEFLRAVREKSSDVPFVLFTGAGSEDIASAAISANVTAYVQRDEQTDQYAVLANRVADAVEQYRTRQTRKRQSEALETAREGISILDQDGTFVYVNAAYADLYGYQPEALLGEHWQLLAPDDEVGFLQHTIFPAVADAGYWNGETTGLRADGTTFSEDCTVVQTDDGELICSVRDRSAEKERQANLTRFRALVETLDDPVYVLDETGQFEYVNDAFTEMVGYNDETILGASPSLVKSAEAAERGRTNLARILSSDGPDSVQFEIEIQSQSGEHIPCEDHMGVLPYEGDRFQGSVGILRDITARKERERELHRQNERLEEFASVVSHDLRNPLSVAEGNLELAQTECDSERLETVQQALQRMEALIEDLLNLARGNEGISDLEPVDLHTMGADCWETVETKDATLHTETEQTILADASRLRQLIENLMGNAIDHGGEAVTITIGELENGFYIEDDGPGIPDAETADIFRAGYSTDETGTGFGLSIVETVVDAHDWNIHLTESSTGGARFEITNVAFDE